VTTLHKCDDETGFLSVFWLVQSTLCAEFGLAVAEEPIA